MTLGARFRDILHIEQHLLEPKQKLRTLSEPGTSRKQLLQVVLGETAVPNFCSYLIAAVLQKADFSRSLIVRYLVY